MNGWMDEWMDESMNQWTNELLLPTFTSRLKSSKAAYNGWPDEVKPQCRISAEVHVGKSWLPESSASFLQNGRISSRRSSEWSLAWSSWILKWCQSEQHGSSIFLVTCIFELNYNNINPRDLHLCPFLFLNPLSHWSHSKSEQIRNKSDIMYNQIFYTYTYMYTYTKKYVRTPSHQVQYSTSD